MCELCFEFFWLRTDCIFGSFLYCEYGKECVDSTKFFHHKNQYQISHQIKVQLDAPVCSLIYFTANSLYMFRVSTAPIIRNTKNCNRYWS